jgi:uncharacterized membrane protein YeaQ/YmgE (transglycosylase-associated protein family)
MLRLLWGSIIGSVVDVLAQFLMLGKAPGGIWITMMIGIAGSVRATWLGQVIG